MQANLILYVADQATSAAFYRAALGREPRLDVPGMTEFSLGHQAVLGLMPEAGIRRLLGEALPDPGTARGVPRCEVYLEVPDPEAHHLRALGAGAVELSPVLARDWGDDVGYSLDPDGHVLAFARSAHRQSLEPASSPPPSRNLETVSRYLDGFRRNDHRQILSCLTDDIQWTVFGAFRLTGKDAYDKAIDGAPEFIDPPELEVVRMVEQGDTVMAELTGTAHRAAGGEMRMSMAEAFVMRDGKIAERRAWVTVLSENDYR